MAMTVPRTSTVEHNALLQRRRRSIAVATGERTATLKTDTKMISSALPIDASAPATATMPAATSSVRTEMDTTTSGRPVSLTALPASPLGSAACGAAGKSTGLAALRASAPTAARCVWEAPVWPGTERHSRRP